MRVQSPRMVPWEADDPAINTDTRSKLGPLHDPSKDA